MWCFLHWLPTNSLLPRLDIANDRQLYLAMIGPAYILAATLARLPRRGFIAAAFVVSVTLGSATVIRNYDYRSEIALWESTVQDSPTKARAWNNLGYAYRLAGERDAARRAYVKALELDPNHRKAHYNLQSLDRGDN
jgi:tetratricopeptide (TPR) repeat protein